MYNNVNIYSCDISTSATFAQYVKMLGNLLLNASYHSPKIIAVDFRVCLLD